MANAKKCDRCGELYSTMVSPDIRILKYVHGYDEFKIELCSQCQDELENWFKQKSEVKK